jgi:hypothetical protein
MSAAPVAEIADGVPVEPSVLENNLVLGCRPRILFCFSASASQITVGVDEIYRGHSEIFEAA